MIPDIYHRCRTESLSRQAEEVEIGHVQHDYVFCPMPFAGKPIAMRFNAIPSED